MHKYIKFLFSKQHWKSTLKGLALIICSILYPILDDHSDKILTAAMTILAADFITRTKEDI